MDVPPCRCELTLTVCDGPATRASAALWARRPGRHALDIGTAGPVSCRLASCQVLSSPSLLLSLVAVRMSADRWAEGERWANGSRLLPTSRRPPKRLTTWGPRCCRGWSSRASSWPIRPTASSATMGTAPGRTTPLRPSNHGTAYTTCYQWVPRGHGAVGVLLGGRRPGRLPTLVDRVWRTRSDAEETMTSAARPVLGRPVTGRGTRIALSSKSPHVTARTRLRAQTVGTVPPSITYSAPTMAEARSETRNPTRSAISSVLANRPRGTPPRES